MIRLAGGYGRLRLGPWLVALGIVVGVLACDVREVGTSAPPTDAENCAQAVLDLEPLVGDVPVLCAATPHEDGYGGTYDGHLVRVYPLASQLPYYREVLAHELGHAWEHRLSDLDRRRIQEVLGWPGVGSWSPAENEAFADVYALAVGYWTDYGDGWRHPPALGQPTSFHLRQLRAEGLLPAELPADG